MASDIEEICDGVVTHLGTAFPGVYEVSRVTVPRFDIDSLTGAKPVIFVVPSGRSSTNFNRGFRQYTYTILVFIAQLMPSMNGDETDDLIEKTILISNSLERLSLTSHKAKEESVSVTLFDTDSLLTENNFRSLVTLTMTGGLRSV